MTTVTNNKIKVKGAEAIVEFLEAQGVDKLFGIPGAAILPFYDSIRTSSIQSIVVRHEQMAAFMADGYARATGKVGICAATSGPGATNLLTGLYGAMADAVPLLAFTGQVATNLIGKDAFQEAPLVEMAKPVTKMVFQPKSAEEIPLILRQAWYEATTGRKGPVLIDLPLDVQKQETEIDLAEIKEKIPAAKYPNVPDEILEVVLNMIKKAKNPVIIAGGGVISAEATAELKELAEALALPVVATLAGKSAFPNDHPLFGGQMGTMCFTPLGNHIVNCADLILGLGNRFDRRNTGKTEYWQDKKIIHVNIDPKEVNRNIAVDLNITYDLKLFLKNLVDLVNLKSLAADEEEKNEKVKELALKITRFSFKREFDGERIKPQEAILELRKHLARDAVVTHDCGISQIWSAQFFESYQPRTYLVTARAGTMGWGLGAAMAAKLAYPERQCVNLLGDGSLGMSLNDMATAAKFKIPVVVLLLNNSLLGLIRQQQNLNYGCRIISTDLDYENETCGHNRGIDFVTVARGMGWQAERVEKREELGEAIDKALSFGKPYLLEVLVDPEEVCNVSANETLTESC